MSWNNLSMRERAGVMRLAIENGIYDLDTIRAGYNSFAEGGDIHISPSKKGTFTAAASKHNMGVQEFASKVLANKDDYSTAMVRKANFARNAKSWRHDLGGELIQAAQEGGIKYLGRRSSRYDDGGSKSDWRDNHVYEAGSLPEIVVNSENTDATPKKHFVRYNEEGNPVYTTDYSLSQNALNNLLPEGEATRRRRNWTLENVGSNGIQRPGLHGYAQDIANYAEIGIGGALAPLVISHFAPTVGKVALNTFNAAGDAVVESPLGQLAKSFFTNPYVDAALTSLGGAHAAQSIANGEANAMTALELLPMTRVIKPAYRAVKSFVGPAAKAENMTLNSLKGPIVESANASQTMEQLEEAYRTPATSKITTENAASITPTQWTAAQDAAIAKGDMTEAQRLRDLHFKVSAPNTKITDGIYHGSRRGKDFNSFDLRYFGYTDGGTGGYGHYFGPLNHASAYTNPRRFYINVQNPYTGKHIQFFNRDSYFRDNELFGRMPSREDVVRYKEGLEKYKNEFIGKDGVIDNDPIWGDFGPVYTVPRGEQIKLADAVTFDDNGVRIPLGERDNFNINDIRYGWMPWFLGAATVYGTSQNKKSLGGYFKSGLKI